MALIQTRGARIAGVTTCVPTTRFDNLTDWVEFTTEEIRKVTAMAGVAARRVAGDSVCSSDLCVQATEKLMQSLDWAPESIDALIMVTQTPDCFLPATACVNHQRLGLADGCGGLSVPMALTLGGLDRPGDRSLRTLLLGYGVGLSWGSALGDLDPHAILDHIGLDHTAEVSA